MSLSVLAALIYAGCCGVITIFHMAMFAGAPWGHLTMGGKYEGRLPPRARILPLIAGSILMFFAVAVLSYGGVLDVQLPNWTRIPVIAVTVLTTVANLATPSIPERNLWGPVTVLMTLSLGVVVFA